MVDQFNVVTVTKDINRCLKSASPCTQLSCRKASESQYLHEKERSGRSTLSRVDGAGPRGLRIGPFPTKAQFTAQSYDAISPSLVRTPDMETFLSQSCRIKGFNLRYSGVAEAQVSLIKRQQRNGNFCRKLAARFRFLISLNFPSVCQCVGREATTKQTFKRVHPLCNRVVHGSLKVNFVKVSASEAWQQDI